MLPVLKDLVVQPLSLAPHPRVEGLLLSLWPLSGSRVRMQAFLKELRSSQRKHSDSPLATLMSPVWTLSGSGVPRSLAPTTASVGVVADFFDLSFITRV